MISSWSPVCNIIKQFNIGTIRIPIGTYFKDFIIHSVKIENDEIIIHLFSKLK